MLLEGRVKVKVEVKVKVKVEMSGKVCGAFPLL